MARQLVFLPSACLALAIALLPTGCPGCVCIEFELYAAVGQLSWLSVNWRGMKPVLCFTKENKSQGWSEYEVMW